MKDDIRTRQEGRHGSRQSSIFVARSPCPGLLAYNAHRDTVGRCKTGCVSSVWRLAAPLLSAQYVPAASMNECVVLKLEETSEPSVLAH